jgi:hypothetical protein
VAFAIAGAPTLSDVTSQLKVVRGGFVYNARTRTYSQTLTITNTGAALNGPLSLLLDGLTSGVTLTNQSGITTASHGAAPVGTSYLVLPATSLAGGASVSITLQFSAVTTPSYTPQFLLGSGTL